MKLWMAILILVYAILSGLFGFAAFAVLFSVLVLTLLWTAAFEPAVAAEQRRLALKQLQASEELLRELRLMRAMNDGPTRGMTAGAARRQS